MLAQVSNGKLELGGIFDGLKVDLDKYNDIINSFKDIDLSLPAYKDFNTGKANWDAIAKDKLTYAEKGQLEELQEITKELLLLGTSKRQKEGSF